MAGTLEPIGAVIPAVKRIREAKASKNLKKAQPTSSMIKRAVKENNVRGGTSILTIYKYIESNYDVNDSYRARVKRALTKLVDDRVLVKKTGTKYSLAIKPKKKKIEVKEKKDKKKTTKKTTKAESKTAKSSKATKGKKTPEKKTKAVSKKGVTKERVSKSKTPAKAKTPKPSGGTTKTSRGKAKASKPQESSKKGSSTDKLVWVWQYHDKNFKNYDPHASDLVEGVYQEFLTSPYTCDVREVKSGQWHYMIDFRQMTQTNTKHESHTVRNIRRIQIPESEKEDTTKAYK
jgi:hypothetical protein